jgi:hypothetical protein
MDARHLEIVGQLAEIVDSTVRVSSCHFARTPTKAGLSLLPVNLFIEPEHKPFLLEGSSRRPLIHGFGGTPAESPSANVDRQADRQALLLPGFALICYPARSALCRMDRQHNRGCGGIEEAGRSKLLVVDTP